PRWVSPPVPRRCDELAAAADRSQALWRYGPAVRGEVCQPYLPAARTTWTFTIMKPGGPRLSCGKRMASVRIGGGNGFGIVSPTRQARRAGRHGPSTTTGPLRSGDRRSLAILVGGGHRSWGRASIYFLTLEPETVSQTC